jgi:hypothetical protein
MRRRTLVVVTALLFLASGLSLPSLGSQDGSRAEPTITIDPGTTYQSIASWEATAWMGQDSSPNFANYSDEVLDLAAFDLGINRLRLEFRAGIENPEDYWTQ